MSPPERGRPSTEAQRPVGCQFQGQGAETPIRPPSLVLFLGSGPRSGGAPGLQCRLPSGETRVARRRGGSSQQPSVHSHVGEGTPPQSASRPAERPRVRGWTADPPRRRDEGCLQSRAVVWGDLSRWGRCLTKPSLCIDLDRDCCILAVAFRLPASTASSKFGSSPQHPPHSAVTGEEDPQPS